MEEILIHLSNTQHQETSRLKIQENLIYLIFCVGSMFCSSNIIFSILYRY